jgi:hypothetical protein
MVDLFGDTITRPETIPARGIDNSAGGFIAFWSAWPAGPRKVAKQQCLNKWATLGCARFGDRIYLHIEWMKAQKDWIEGFVPMPLTYLNQQRWVDWVPCEPPKRPVIDPALEKLNRDAKQAAPMPAHVRERLAQLRSRA